MGTVTKHTSGKAIGKQVKGASGVVCQSAKVAEHVHGSKQNVGHGDKAFPGSPGSPGKMGKINYNGVKT